MLSWLAGQPVKAISMHNPSVNGRDLFSDLKEFKNAYDYVVSNSRAYDPNAKLEGVYVQKMVSKGAEVDHRGIERRIVLNHSFYLELEEFSLRSYGIHR